MIDLLNASERWSIAAREDGLLKFWAEPQQEASGWHISIGCAGTLCLGLHRDQP